MSRLILTLDIIVPDDTTEKSPDVLKAVSAATSVAMTILDGGPCRNEWNVVYETEEESIRHQTDATLRTLTTSSATNVRREHHGGSAPDASSR